jgi:hypothetical protein
MRFGESPGCILLAFFASLHKNNNMPQKNRGLVNLKVFVHANALAWTKTLRLTNPMRTGSGVAWQHGSVAAGSFSPPAVIAYPTLMVSVFLFVNLCCSLHFFVAFSNTLLFLYIY